MAGYQRQAAANIQPDLVVLAEDLNAEFNTLANAFSASTGHAHDGSVGSGPRISLTSSVVGTLPVANGGTGGTTQATARTGLGLGTLSVLSPTGTADNTAYLRGDGVWAALPPSGVLSVNVSVPTGLLATGGPVTSSGTIAITYATGYQGFTTSEATKLSGIQAGAQVNPGVATTSANGLMSSADKTKLNGIATGATANATDAQLRARSSHTGTQAISTVSGLQTALDSKLNLSGGTLTGKLNINAPANTAPINIGVDALGSQPSSLSYGDVYVHMNKLYVKGYSSDIALGSTGDLSLASQAEAEGGSSTTARSWTSLRVRQNAMAAPLVRQGGGTGQGASKIYIGWLSGNTLGLQVDNTNFGNNWPINISGLATNATTAANAAALNGQAASYYTNITARLGYIPVRRNGGNDIGLSWSGTQPVFHVDSATPMPLMRNVDLPSQLAALGYMDIGQYAFSRQNTAASAIVQGTTVPGSELRWTNARGSNENTSWHPGVWRCHGYIGPAATQTGDRVTLWQRVS